LKCFKFPILAYAQSKTAGRSRVTWCTRGKPQIASFCSPKQLDAGTLAAEPSAGSRRFPAPAHAHVIVPKPDPSGPP